MAEIQLKYLQNFSPFDYTVWGGLNRPITREEVQKAIEEKDFRDKPLGHQGLRIDHIRRVAYLEAHPDPTPLSLDVGDSSWIVIDGNHRLGAAIFRGDETIEVEVSGEVSLIEALYRGELHYDQPTWSMKMKIDKYVETRKAELDAFLTHWKERMDAKDPGYDTDEMPEGEWYQQEIAYNEMAANRDF